VLVNRSHTLFPISPQYTGYELATTLREHVEVVLGKENAVFLK
jgi:pyrimidine operon attenuation protein/uracil phosphoribosyltransferase